ncbi:MAG: 50S ribosomal protein L9 [Patescibacteria group bacterium]|nr:50S ribosomal protein L9 [Patescibacteria group bacterium]
MAVRVVILKNTPNLGREGDIVRVKEGYARNFLLPNGMAELADEQAMQRAKKIKKQKRVEIGKKKKQAQKLLEKIEKIKLKINKKTQKGKLFGSVKENDIIKALKGQGIELKKSQIILGDKEIKKTGTYEIEIELIKGLRGKIKLKVDSEKK